MLVGLASKNAILIVEFATRLQQRGQGRCTRRPCEASQLRLRPIMMTSFAFILGVVPLVIADGAGRGDAPVAGHGGVLRHDRRDAVRHLPDAGVLLRAHVVRQPAGTPLTGHRQILQCIGFQI